MPNHQEGPQVQGESLDKWCAQALMSRACVEVWKDENRNSKSPVADYLPGDQCQRASARPASPPLGPEGYLATPAEAFHGAPFTPLLKIPRDEAPTATNGQARGVWDRRWPKHPMFSVHIGLQG
jgi:hypothetical protein